MPIGPVPDGYHDLLRSTSLGHLATVDSAGRPQVNPVWFIWDGDYLLLSVRPGTSKFRNLQANPAMAISVLDRTNDYHYLEMRGRVIEFQLFDNLSWVNQLANKYTGADYTRGVDGELRYKVVVRIDSWTGQG